MKLFLELVFGALTVGLPIAFILWRNLFKELPAMTPAQYNHERYVAAVEK